jgi:predicted dehydrogenase
MLSGTLGTVSAADIRIQRFRTPEYFNDPYSWRTDRSISGGGVLINIGIHYLDLACWMLGKPNDISARYLEYNDGIESRITSSFRLGKTACTIDARWGNVLNLDDSLNFATTNGVIEFKGDHLLSLGFNEELDKYELHARQLQDFVCAIREQRPPLVTPMDVKSVLYLILELYQSAGINENRTNE